MNCIKLAFLTILLLATACAGANADQLTRVIQYHEDQQPTIYCATGLICEIRLAKGEKLTNPWIGEQLWSGNAGMVGNTPVFLVKPEWGGLRTNLVLATDAGRDYHIMLVSYDYNPKDPNSHLKPLYNRFAYDDETWQHIKNDRRRIRNAHRTVRRKPHPLLTVAEQMYAACARMQPNEVYGIDPNPIGFRPVGLPIHRGRPACHNQYATYIQMPINGPNPTDVPALIEIINGTKRIVNYTYDSRSRIFKVDDVGPEYALTTGQGKHEAYLRIQWQERKVDHDRHCHRGNHGSCQR